MAQQQADVAIRAGSIGWIGSVLAGVTPTGLWVVYPVVIAVLVVGSIFRGSVLRRRLEFAADRRGATLLGSTALFRALLEPAVIDRNHPSWVWRLVDLLPSVADRQTAS